MKPLYIARICDDENDPSHAARRFVLERLPLLKRGAGDL